MDKKLSDNILTELDEIVTVNGQLNQTHVLSAIQKQVQYQLSYEAVELVAEKNYVLIYVTYEDGTVHTYFFPIQFIGPQKIVFDVPFQVANIQFSINGSMKIKDTKLQSVITDALTEEEKIALGKVSTNSDYWDRIIAITNSLGNVITNKLEGTINTALNTITGASGKMYWEDGKFVCRDGETDAKSTMAMMISPGGFMIADSKKADGGWDWRTFGTGKGFVADEIIAGTLRAIAIEGVSITGSTLTGGTIIGATIKGGSLNIADKYIVDSDGDIQMLGNITWGATNSPVKVKYSSDNTNWHYDFVEGDTFAKYSYDGGLTWTAGIKIRGTDGLNGVPGTNGTDGRTYYTWIAYADTSTGGGISLSAVNKKYIGIAYNQLSQTPQLTASKYAWSKILGEDGLDGTDGIPGQNGTDGKTYYTWIRYADNAQGSGISNSSTNKAYIGIAYNKATATESNNPIDYTWTKIKGDAGAPGLPGTNGKDGINGADGRTYYTWIKYADDNKGSGMSDYPQGKLYIGLAYNQTSPNESNSPSAYTWSKFVGEDGLNGKDGVPGTNGLDGKIYYVWIKYADSPTSGMSDNPSGKAYLGVAYNKETPIESSNYNDYTWSKIIGETGAQGATGPQGPQGPAGSDANVPSYIQSTKITGTTVESCTLSGNYIWGSSMYGGTIAGSTIYAGNTASVYTLLDQENPLSVWRPTGKVAELWGGIDGSSHLKLYSREYMEKFTISSGAFNASDTLIRDTGKIDVKSDKAIDITSTDAFTLHCWNRTSAPYIITGRSYMEIGNGFVETYVIGTNVHINCNTFYVNGKTQVASLESQSISELEIAYMELEDKYLKESLARSELEVKLMEKGVL